MAATITPTDRKIEVPLGTYTLDYSPRLVRSIDHLPEGYATAEPGKSDFYDALKVSAVMGKSLPRAGEEQAIYAQRSAGAKKLADIEELKDYFAINDKGVYIWGHTLTGLRFRKADLGKPYNTGDKVTAEVVETDITPYLNQIADPQFTRDNWKDIIDKVNHVKGEMADPYARGHVITAMHPIFGIFTEVEPTMEHKAPYALHGWLPENLKVLIDPISGHYEVAVVRWSLWPRGERCLGVGARYGRWDAGSVDGFRPVVRGSEPAGPRNDVASDDVDTETVRQRAQFASDLRTHPFPELLEKYKL